MKKTALRALAWAMVLVMALLPVCACAEIETLKKSAAVTAFSLEQEGAVLRFSFMSPDNEYLCLKYQDADESGMMTLEKEDGRFSGDIPLAFSQTAKKVTVTLLSISQKELFKARAEWLPTQASAVSDAAGACAKVEDLTLTPQANGVSYRFTAPGRASVRITFSSVMQKGNFLVYPDENGVFEGALTLPCAHARDLVTVTLSTVKNKQLAKTAERIAFTAPDAGETAADGPLSGVVVCLDPGHQALPVSIARVQKMPGSNEKAAGGSAGMGQGTVTLRKESVVVLEIAYRTCRALRELGATVYMTRWSEDVSVTNMERAEYANSVNADYFVRIHLNMAEKKTASAIYVYSPNKSEYAYTVVDQETYRAMTQALLEALQLATGVDAGRTRFSDQFIANNWAKMPAFLVEGGFLSTPGDDLKCSLASYQEKIARGIADGVVRMQQIKESAARE